jgi:glyoxylase-like metal-dependent hydrolase (beta-lactamase superfamily II)
MMDPIALPAFTDNTIWMLQDGRDAVVVDPGDAAPVQKALDERNLRLAAILVTHHHPDHVGGVDALRPRHAQACETLRAAALPTLPSSLTKERQINPFLRCDAPEVVASARAHGANDDSGVEVFATLREWKNRFR